MASTELPIYTNIPSKYRVSKQWLVDPLKLENASLIQIGMTFFDDLTKVSPHKHNNFFELTIIDEGEGEVVINGDSVRVKKNDICITMPYDTHEIVSSKTNLLKIRNIAFSVIKPSLSQEYNRILRDYFNSDCRRFSDKTIVLLVELILKEIINEDNLNKELVSSLLDSMMHYIIKNFKEIKLANDKDISDYDILCFQIMNYINTNIMTINNLNEITEVFNYSYPYLSAVFNKTTKTTLREYFYNAKMEKSRELLFEQKIPVYKVAEKLNYSSSNAFTKAFKNKYGVSPSKITPTE
ncbi:MAG: AraC family transcriptional regulator [Clostridia bacterium]|nr:AraC family transcriptional regulator [Clostridia bacterium]